MRSTDYYRDRATYYRQAAEETLDPKMREQLDIFAKEYDELAEAAEHRICNSEGFSARRDYSE
jgi:hypothetical protein